MTNGETEPLVAALGAPLFSTAFYVPPYRETSAGRWKLTRGGFGLDRGYYSGLWTVQGTPVLLRRTDGAEQSWETWMSLSPHEIESQELGCRYAKGHAVVMGLGMGWVAINMALNPAVHRVTVIERDPEVIDLFGRSGALDGLPAEVTDRLRVVEADALEWRPEESVDFLYADIWQRLEEPRTLDDVRRMQANVGAGRVYFWGQELALHAQAQENAAAREGQGWNEGVWCRVSEAIAVPLLFPDDLDYPAMIAQVARLRRERKIPGNAGKTQPPLTPPL